jgi:hypothetical protein
MADVKNATQTDRVLKHLQSVGSITQVEAQAMYKSRSLTKRISELRDRGYDIKSEWKTDHTGQRYVRYWLRKKEPVVTAPYGGLPLADFGPSTNYTKQLAQFLAGDHKIVESMFVWSDTPQGGDYWFDIFKGDTTNLAEATKILVQWGEQLRAREAA